GRDVESMIRDLTEMAVGMVRQEHRGLVETEAKKRVSERLLDLLLPQAGGDWEGDESEGKERRRRTREKMRGRLEAGEMEDRTVEMAIESKPVHGLVLSGVGMEQMEADLQGMLERIMPRQAQQRRLTVKEARKVLLDQETEALIDKQVVIEK